MEIVSSTHIPGLNLLGRGKVRDIYEVDAQTLLIVTTDRMSAFDVVMREPIPFKGVILNQLTIFWMRLLENIIPNHLIADDPADFPSGLKAHAAQLNGRAVLARRAQALPVECIARGYLAGSGWEEYLHKGTLAGQHLPAGLLESQRLPAPLFTPSTKAAPGEHDMPITPAEACKILGDELCGDVERTTLEIYRLAVEYAGQRGLIVADTKLELGLVGGELILIDEVLTPDCSRFWAKAGFEPGLRQPSFDKQYLRDWLSAQAWDKTPPPPALPDAIIAQTAAKYREAYNMITGRALPF